MAPSRRHPVALVAAALFLIVWMAGLIVAALLLLASLRGGEWAPALFLAAWLGIAAVALYRVGLGFLETLSGERLRPPRRSRAHARRWRDGMPERQEP